MNLIITDLVKKISKGLLYIYIYIANYLSLFNFFFFGVCFIVILFFLDPMLGLWIQAWIQLLRHRTRFQLEVRQLCIPLLPTLETMRWVVLVRGFMVVNIFHLIKVQSHLLAPVQSHTGHDSICNFEMSSAGQWVHGAL